jgi:phosphoglycolate phosphatase-like HAD superfamily hydrolase
MNIAIDCDQVLVDTGAVLFDYYRDGHPGADILGFPMRQYSIYWPVWNGDRSVWRKWFESWWASPYFTKINPMPGAVVGVAALKSAGHNLSVVSMAGKAQAARRREHLERLFGKKHLTK